jgi:arsenite methyltransferase
MQEQAIKEKINERYGKIALEGNSESCYAPTQCCGGSDLFSAVQMAKNIGYDAKELEAVPESSILGVRQ